MDLVGLLIQQPQGRVLDSLDGRCEPFDWLAAVETVQINQGGLHVCDQRTGRFAAVHRQLASDQVHRLDAVGAFVDRGDARVAIVLGGASFLDEAHTAVDLDPH